MKVTPFSLYLPIAKSYDSEDGQSWVWEAPVSNPDEDLEGDSFSAGDVAKGLETCFALGAQLDWDHQYPKTHDPKWIIGKAWDRFEAKHPKSEHVVPWVRGEFSKSKEIARNAVEHLNAGLPLGISVYGALGRRASGETYPIITMLSATPTPVVSENTGTMRLVKAVAALPTDADLARVVLPQVPGIWTPLTVDELDPWGILRKALEAMTALTKEGPGADAVGVGELTEAGGRPRKRKRKRAGAEEEIARKALGILAAARLRGARENRHGS